MYFYYIDAIYPRKFGLTLLCSRLRGLHELVGHTIYHKCVGAHLNVMCAE